MRRILNRNKLQLLAFCTFFLFLHLAGHAQSNAVSMESVVTIKAKNISLSEVFQSIKKQTGLIFFYSNSLLNDQEKVNLNFKNAPLKEVLAYIFNEKSINYEIRGNRLLINSLVQGKAIAFQGPKPKRVSNDQITVRGLIKDQLGNPLMGATIQIVGKTEGTFTNSKGEYSIQVEPTDSLRFSYTGYQDQVLPVRNRIDMDIVMIPNEGSLNQVVVVGYGTQKKISMVGSQSSLKVEDIKLPVANLNTVLAGRLAGVVSVQRTAEPGSAGADIWIRGISTFSSSLSKPLILVDGVPRSFSDIDPEDIASFSILKDASATAVYGVRGANGVILIITKSGQVGAPKINFQYNDGVTSFIKLPEFASGETYMKMANEAVVTRGGSPLYDEDVINATKNRTDPDLHPDVAWFQALFNKYGHTRNANLNISGGSENAQYYVGTSYYDETGMYKQDSLQNYSTQAGYKRYNLTSNLTVKATKSTTIKLGVQGYLANVNYPGTGLGTIFSDAFLKMPISYPIKYSDGLTPDIASSRLTNPYAELTQTGYINQWRSSLSSNLRVTQNLDFWLKGLSFTGMFAFDTYDYTSMHRTKVPDTYLAIGRDSAGNLIQQLTNPGKGTEFLDYSLFKNGTRSLYNEAAINYSSNFGKHDVSAMVLFNQSDLVNTQASDLVQSLPFRFRGLAGRTTYGYNNKYFLEGNFGYNGSENFAPGHRYGFFPSIGAGWVASREKFFEPLKNVIQLFKLRFSYGLVGNSQIVSSNDVRFAYIGTVDNTTGFTFGQNMDNSYIGRDIGEYAVDVVWETAKKTNLGVDINALDNKLNFQADLFREHRSGIFLRRASLPAYVGLRNAPYGNVGVVDNKGIDGSLTWRGKVGEINYQFMGNFTWNRNRVIENDQPEYKYPWMEGKGRKVGQRFGYQALGYFTSESEIENSSVQNGDVRPGDLKFKDINGDGKIDAYDMVPIGYGVVPEIVYGIGFSFQYKAFSLSGLFQGIGNVDISLGGQGLQPFQQGLSSGNLLSNITSRWTPENPDPKAFYPRLSAGTLNDNYESSTWWLKNGKYLRLKSLQLTYILPELLLKRVHLKSANIFLQGVNVLTITPFKLYDVELGDGRGSAYPNVKTYSAGFAFNF